ncbi:hydantoinase/oxoprolinase family protein [Qaidamihabitans albus]|uniref:hydantoinase/oxoprolinase family protein n=1 Tax=Qaidamihabitans albus TaxID=2795733 RepID=UPI001F3F9098|nr:hydantoinase/oxoprolinase family protein [Qaidamihabitans albus]
MNLMAVDVGGTFTDVVAVVDGLIVTEKVSTDYNDVAAPVLAGAEAIGVSGIRSFNHASTHGLNAVITRQLPKVGFLNTIGHRDVLDMGRVWRPPSAILDPGWRRSFGDAARPLVPRYLRRGIQERMLADGSVLFELDEDQAREQLEVLKRCDVEGVGICLINAYVDPSHEQRLRELVHEALGDVPCSISGEVSPLAKEYARASTTLIDVLMKIIYRDYSARLHGGLEELGFAGQLNYADCAATLVPADRAMLQPARIVFSGPSAGTVASAHFGTLIGEDRLLCADVGGTSCDISVVTGGEPFVNTSFELEHDLVVNALANDISAIGAGGGSLITVGPAGEIRVGPESAGADPGPACYARGGTQPTTTDTCLMMGIIDPDNFAGGQFKLDKERARAAFDALDCNLTLPERVRHAYDMAIHNISEGLFNVAMKNGVDPGEYSLMAYGAAGPMLLPAVMDTIRCKQVVVPPNPGHFSALGLISTDQVYTFQRGAYTVLTEDVAEEIRRLYDEMENEARALVGDETSVTLERSFDGCLVGQSWETPFVPVPSGPIDGAAIAAMVEAFHETYDARSGNRFEHFPVQAATFRVRAVVDTPKVSYPVVPERSDGELVPSRTATLSYLGAEAADSDEAAVYPRTALRRGDVLAGPAVVVEALSTTHIGAGQVATVGQYGELLIRRSER